MNSTATNSSPSPSQFDWNSFKLQTETVKNIAAIVGILFGGLWAFYSFGALNEAERAEAELTLAQAEVNSTFSRLSIEIDAKPVETTEGTVLIANVHVKNVGTQPVAISSRWGQSDPDSNSGQLTYHPPFAAYKVAFDEFGQVERHHNNGTVVLKNSLFGHPMTIPAKSRSQYQDDKSHSATVTWEFIRVGETRRIPFVVKITEPGVYLCAYRVFVGFSKDEQAIYKRFTERERLGATWSSRIYVPIDKVSRKQASILEEPGNSEKASSTAEEEKPEEEEEEEEEE